MKRVRVAIVVVREPDDVCGYLDCEADSDTAAEQAARARLEALFPGAGIAVQVVNRLGLEARS